jgi:hypothetical protein
MTRREQVAICRLHTGYTRATDFAVMNKKPSQECPLAHDYKWTKQRGNLEKRKTRYGKVDNERKRNKAFRRNMKTFIETRNLMLKKRKRRRKGLCWSKD